MHAFRVTGPRDYEPPRWLVHLLSRRSVPVPYRAAARGALVLALPLAVGFAVDRPDLGALASIGGLPVVLADDGGPYRRRVFRLGGAALTALIGYVIGSLTLELPALASPVIVVLALSSVLVARVGAASGVAGMLLLVFGVIGAAEHHGQLGLGALLASFAAGMAWSLVVGFAGWAVRGTAPERDAVAKVFVGLAVMLGDDDPATSRAARYELTVAMNTAYDRLLTTRAWLPSRDAAYRSLFTLLTQATPIVEAAVAMLHAGERAPRPVVDHLTRVAAAILTNSELPETPDLDPFLEGEAGHGVAALCAGLRRLDSGHERTPRSPATMGGWLREQAAELVPDRLALNSALRLGLCVTLAEIVGHALPMEHQHWITLTVAIVLRPELGSVFGRTVLRGIGTVAGVLVGALVVLIEPNGWLLVGFAAMFAAGAVVGKAINYGIMSASITPLIIVQLDLQHLGDPAILTERLTHTVLGCVIVLVVGYWLWPGSLRPRVGGRVADTLGAVREYVARGLRVPGTGDTRSVARRDAYRALAELRTAFSQVIVEPSAAGRQAMAWWPAIVALERMVDAVTEVAVSMDHGGLPPSGLTVDGIVDALDELADAVREGREPVRIRIAEAGTATGAVDELNTVFDAMSGPGVR
ncbi:MAG: FUSC family protein [Actinophytocola sp.]|nr:FUSC family protein [Actinophytocola sp.]